MTTIPSLPFSGQQLRDTLTALDGAIDGKEASGAAAAAVAAHVAGADPHTQYTTAVEAAAAAPVQGVALSVPSGWSGSSANVGGNVTLTLGLPAGSSLVGSSDRTSWDTAFTERNRWDGGVTGLNASTGRSSLGLGNVDNTSDANKPVSTATATALAGKANTGAIGSSGLTMATARLLGRSTAGSGAPEEVTLGANLTLSGGILSASVTGGGGGTVSSVGLVAPTGFSVSGSPVTTSGNITLNFAAGYSLPTTASQGNWDTAFAERLYWDGGSTGLNAATGRTSLGLGGAAVLNVGTGADTVAAGNDSRLTTDLSFDASTRLLSSSTGADVTLPLVTSTTAGLAPLSGGGTTNFLRADGAWAAPPSGGGGGAAPAPGYATFASGALIAPFNYAGGTASGNASAGLVCYHPIYIPETQVFTQILCRTGSAYAGTTDLLLGIYSHDATSNRPLSKIYDSGSLQITVSGAANYAPGTISLSLSPGFYWLAFLATAVGATPAFVGTPTNARGIGFPWFTEVTTAGAMVTGLTQGGQSTLPATANAVQAVSAVRPVVFLGV